MLILTALLALLFVAIYKRRKQMSILERLRIPGPRPNLIFGNLIEFGREGFSRTFLKWTKKYGPIVGFYIGGRPQLLVTDIELIRRILIKDFHKFINRGEIVPGGVHPVPQLQNSIIWARDNAWKSLRASMTPAFSPHKLNSMMPLMMSTTEEMISGFGKKADSGEEFNLNPFINQFTFATAIKCIFGLDGSTNQLKIDIKQFFAVTRPRLDKSILAIIMALFPSLTFIVYPLRLWWERFRFYMLWSPEGYCFDITKKILQARRDTGTQSVDFLQLLKNTKRIQTTTVTDWEMSSEDANPKENVLSRESHSENFSDNETVSNALIFLLGSADTTAVTIECCLHNLINHQNVQDELRNKLRKAVKRSGNTISPSTLSEVPLLLHIVKETLRMFPPLTHGLTRLAAENYEYQGIVIPKGTVVFIGVPQIHNDSNIWPEPEEFRPERFQEDYDKSSYLSFSTGPRSCVGMRFAYMEVQLVLARLILHYRFEPGPSTEKKLEMIETTVTSVPKIGVFCKVIRLEE